MNMQSGGQQARSEAEQALPEYRRLELDRARAALIRDAMDHPAICAALDRLERTCDEILSRLKMIRPTISE